MKGALLVCTRVLCGVG